MSKLIRSLPSLFTIEVDTREQKPLLFPSHISLYTGDLPKRVRLRTLPSTLKAGDYRLLSHPTLACIERKGSVRELCKNFLSRDWERQLRSLAHLCSDYQHPYLLVEESVYALTTRREPNTNPDLLLQRISSILTRLPVRLLIVGAAQSIPARRRIGLFAASLLLGHTHDSGGRVTERSDQ